MVSSVTVTKKHSPELELRLYLKAAEEPEGNNGAKFQGIIRINCNSMVYARKKQAHVQITVFGLRANKDVKTRLD